MKNLSTVLQYHNPFLTAVS